MTVLEMLGDPNFLWKFRIEDKTKYLMFLNTINIYSVQRESFFFFMRYKIRLVSEIL